MFGRHADIAKKSDEEIFYVALGQAHEKKEQIRKEIDARLRQYTDPRERVMALHDELIRLDNTGRVKDTFFARSPRREYHYLENSMRILCYKYEACRKCTALTPKEWETIYSECLYMGPAVFVERMQLYILLDTIERLCYNPSEYRHWRENYVMDLFRELFTNSKRAKRILSENEKPLKELEHEERDIDNVVYGNIRKAISGAVGGVNSREYKLELLDYAINVIGEDLQCRCLLHTLYEDPLETAGKDRYYKEFAYYNHAVADLLPYNLIVTEPDGTEKKINAKTGKVEEVNITKVNVVPIMSANRKGEFLKNFNVPYEKLAKRMKPDRPSHDLVECVYFPYINLLFANEDGNHRLARSAAKRSSPCPDIYVRAHICDITELFRCLDVTEEFTPDDHWRQKLHWDIHPECEVKDTYAAGIKHEKRRVLDLRLALLYSLAKQKYRIEYLEAPEPGLESELEGKTVCSYSTAPLSNSEKAIIEIKHTKQDVIIDVFDLKQRYNFKAAEIQNVLLTAEKEGLVKRKFAVDCSERVKTESEERQTPCFDTVADIPPSFDCCDLRCDSSKISYRIVFVRTEKEHTL